jgi:hypothetical protein
LIAAQTKPLGLDLPDRLSPLARWLNVLAEFPIRRQRADLAHDDEIALRLERCCRAICGLFHRRSVTSRWLGARLDAFTRASSPPLHVGVRGDECWFSEHSTRL